MSIVQNNSEKPSRLIPVSHWNKYHDYPSVSGLRYLIFNEKANGFSSVVRRVGRRVLISENDFFSWVEQQQPKEGGLHE